jgi:hypothetical protein
MARDRSEAVVSRAKSTSGTYRSLLSLVEALEAAAASLPSEPSVGDFVRLVAEREGPAARLGEVLATIDPASLEVPERRELAARVRGVLAADQMLTAAMFARQQDVAAELARIGHARRVASAAKTSRRPLRRVA